MKRFTVLAIAALALLAPTIAYGEGAKFVYRPELKQWVVVPPAAQTGAGAVTPTPNDMMAKHEAMMAKHDGMMAKHEAMMAAHRGDHTAPAQAASCCEKMMAGAHEAKH